MSRPGKSQFAVLGLLTLGPQTGYQIKKMIDGSLSHFWAEGFGQIYPVLKHLVVQGWAVQRGGAGSGARGQKLYAITPEGQAALERWLAEPSELPSYRSELLLKLFFGRHRPTAVNAKDVARLREANAALLEEYRTIELDLRRQVADTLDAEYWLMTLLQGQLYSRSVIEWCDRTLEALERVEKGARATGKPPRRAKRAKESSS